jgi:NAD(P) transhydrogenase subunit beta
MDAINPSFRRSDVVIVLGAKDVVNPVARTDPTAPSPAYRIQLFAADNILMLFGDGKKMMQDLMAAVKQA